MDNRRVKFCLKILSRLGKIIRKPQGVKFFGAPCMKIINTFENEHPRALFHISKYASAVEEEVASRRSLISCISTQTTASRSTSIKLI